MESSPARAVVRLMRTSRLFGTEQELWKHCWRPSKPRWRTSKPRWRTSKPRWTPWRIPAGSTTAKQVESIKLVTKDVNTRVERWVE